MSEAHINSISEIDCPSCDAAGSLEVIRADTRGAKWAWCSVCSKTVLLDSENRVVHKGT
jgi:formate dehydrogenase maturation protein FdhE